MRFDKFTIKSQELVQNAQTLASRHHHQQLEPIHLLSAMLTEKESVARSMFRKLGVSPGAVAGDSAAALEKLPQVSGVTDVYLSTATKAVLEAAFEEAARMKDEYVSIEHILLALADDQTGDVAGILKPARYFPGCHPEGPDGYPG